MNFTKEQKKTLAYMIYAELSKVRELLLVEENPYTRKALQKHFDSVISIQDELERVKDEN